MSQQPLAGHVLVVLQKLLVVFQKSLKSSHCKALYTIMDQIIKQEVSMSVPFTSLINT